MIDCLFRDIALLVLFNSMARSKSTGISYNSSIDALKYHDIKDPEIVLEFLSEQGLIAKVKGGLFSLTKRGLTS
jgi:hypothetical protein